MILIHYGDSVCSYKVRMALAEKGLAYESRQIDLLRFDHLRPDYLRINPNGVVPTLIVSDMVLRESSIINEYLEEIAQSPALLPTRPEDRARVREWVKYQDDVLYWAQRPATFQLIVKSILSRLSEAEITALVDGHPSPERARHFIHYARGPLDREIVDDARAKLRTILVRVDAALSKTVWLAADQFTLADIAFAPFVQRLQRLGFDDLWQDLANTSRWMKAVSERESYALGQCPEADLMPCPSFPYQGRSTSPS